MPETGEDGSIVLNTQGLPYSINGVGDLLALFRCISCKYKFTTDLTKTHTMGAGVFCACFSFPY
jgi:nucleolar complex protein 2